MSTLTGICAQFIFYFFNLLIAFSTSSLYNEAKTQRGDRDMIRPSFLFTSGAVLQREMPVTVFGECDAESITVRYLDYTAVAEVENGRFEAILPPMPANL